MRFDFVARLVLALAILLAVGLAVEARHYGRMLEDDRMLMRAAMESVAARVRTSSEGLRVVRSIAEASALAKARAFAQVIKLNPAVLERQDEMAALAKTLDVDELHVSDDKGVLIAGHPANYIGFDMSSTDQSRVFLPAITNAAFAFVQSPSHKGADPGVVSPYAGVARLDRPGIVQVGFSSDRVETVLGRDGADRFVNAERVVLGCEVTVLPQAGLPKATQGCVRERDASGVMQNTIESDCGAWRIRVTRPAVDSWLADPNAFGVLFVVALILAMLFFLSMTGRRETFVRDVAALRTMFGRRFRVKGAFGRAVRNPATVACGVAFVLAVAITWLLTARLSMNEAKARLQAAMSDMCKSVSSCADNLLFYQGNAIVSHYKKPDAMTVDTVQELMNRYGLDEINVVDRNGIVIAGALADVGYDMSSNANTGKFNCLLNGVKTYSQDFRAPIELPNGSKRKYAGVAFPWPAKGYIQMGFSEDRLKNGIDFWFEDAAVDYHIGEFGYFIVADAETGKVKSCGREDPTTGASAVRRGITLSQAGVDVSTLPKSRNEFFRAKVFGEEALCLTAVICYHRILAVIPLSEIRGGGFRNVILSASVLFGVFVIVVFFMTRLTDLVTSLREKERIERERHEADLTLAKTIQVSSLPLTFPDEPDYRIFARMDTAREVGGDFYDFFELEQDRVLFLIADVSGKGVPAAMFMMRAKAQLRAAVAAYPQDLATAVAEANSALAEANDAEMFVTAWIAVYDRRTGAVDYVNAGHNPPLVRRASGAVEWVRDRSGLALAAIAGARYRVCRLALAPGDSLFLYTDGVTEAMDPAGELYGENRLERTLAGAGEFFVTEVGLNLATFVADAEQSDDITMLAFDVKPHQSQQTEKR